MPRPLTKTQSDLLDAMKRHDGFWHKGCGWVWTTESKTAKMMEALAARGVLKVFEGKHKATGEVRRIYQYEPA